ncbi:hypothetical protein RGQ29_002210 [Quercus rubra]|uniref:TFIIS central domain-containing protein n=1 Tax=Quercus rubra TaxID=3512 RepID=A0AAN7JF38_QUERU|nr:hypothetical protein RGQ29_002210 [Quercus rubra]
MIGEELELLTMERFRESSGRDRRERERESAKSGKSFLWPDAVTALEKAAHETLSSDFQKYNQKLRQLVFNLKKNEVLARRLLNGDLEPSKILNMSPSELKDNEIK